MVRRSAQLVLCLMVSVVLLGACTAPPSTGAAMSRTLPAARSDAVDAAALAEMQRQQLVGVAVGIIEEGQIAYLKGYGWADRENNVPVSVDTVMNWASNCKPMAAVLAMQLVDAKLLDLDADVRTYVPEFPDKQARITARDLLCHQSGICHYRNGRVIPTVRQYQEADPYRDPVVCLDKFNLSPLIFSPGEKTSYSSYAYVLLSAVIQRAGRQPYDEQLQQRVARPLGMRSLQLDVASRDAPHWAAGYRKNLAGQVVPASEEAHYWKFGAGGYKSDIRDFARWAQALTQGVLLSREAEARMWSIQTLASGESTTWGLGFTLRGSGDALRVSHSGQQEEATSWMAVEPRKRSGVVILCNCSYTDMRALAAAVTQALDAPTDTRPVTAMAGRSRSWQ